MTNDRPTVDWSTEEDCYLSVNINVRRFDSDDYECGLCENAILEMETLRSPCSEDPH